MRDYEKIIVDLQKMRSTEYCVITSAPDFPACKILMEAICAIEELLAAVPKQGEWLPHPNPQFTETDVCSVCGIGTRKMYRCTDGVQTWDEKTFYRYCPWCGAKLKEPPKENTHD